MDGPVTVNLRTHKALASCYCLARLVAFCRDSFCFKLYSLALSQRSKGSPVSSIFLRCLWLPWKLPLPLSGWADGALPQGFVTWIAVSLSLLLKASAVKMYVCGCESREGKEEELDWGFAYIFCWALYWYVWPCWARAGPPSPSRPKEEEKVSEDWLLIRV